MVYSAQGGSATVIALAFLWHQHQPYYPDDVAGDNAMPWVRLHGVKDYYGMALHLLEFPEMRCTINLVPSLLVQLQAYTDRSASDRFLDVARQPADGLEEEDCLFLLDHSFMANPDTMIRPFPRFAELHARRGAGRDTARAALRRFNERDLRDLQVWFNLAWVHPILFEKDKDLRAMRDKGRHFTEQEKHWLLDRHLEILRDVIPIHRRLQEGGQVELTTTPFFHPILPLLFDKKLAREAMPDVRLPNYTGGYPEDAALHVRRAVEKHADLFGQPPRGMWPAEGSVCQAMLPLLWDNGIRWIATDEEILSASTQGRVSRDHRGHARNPDAMYRSYRVGASGRELGIVFRDHALSDAIGFHYQRSDPAASAEDFLGKLRGIGSAVPGDALVPVILDGENCWEHYPGGGVAFLRALYERCSRARDVRPVKIGEHLEQNPPRDTLPHLFAGSWINHNFAIWIGHEEDNAAWDALHRTREYLLAKTQNSKLKTQNSAELIARAWEEIYIAEGSDWCWWYGDDHSSAQDAMFDYLFRKHLQNVYHLLGDEPPADLLRPISQRVSRSIYTEPRAFLEVRIDGRRTFFEWAAAGRYTCQNERGTMAMATHGPLTELFFGFDLTRLFLRVDCEGPARPALAEIDALRIGFLEPAGWELLVEHPGQPGQSFRLLHGELTVEAPGLEWGIDQIAEVAIPFDALNIAIGAPVHFFVELLEDRQSRDRAPREGSINLTRPTAYFEQIMWDV
jgi:alpha-amylase/alpha-mannosidase (GH57 family)